MQHLGRRAVLTGAAASALLTAAGGPVFAQAAGPADPAAIDLDRARAEGRVMLYTSLDTQIVDAVIAAFRQEYGISVEYFRGGSADVTSRILAEADANRILADVVDASDLAALLVMKDRNLLKPFRSAAVDAVSPEYRDPDGNWIASRLTQAIIQYNIREFGAQPPRTWRDLADPRMRSRLCYFSSANGDGAPRLYALARAFGWDLLQSYARLSPLRVQTPQVAAQLLERGERGVAFLTNDNIAQRSKAQGRPTDYVFPAEGMPTELGAAGVLRGSSRPHAAMLFHEWWLGKRGQEIMSRMGKYSSRNDVAPPPDLPPLASLKLYVIDSQDYRTNRSQILDRMADIFGGEWGG